MSNFMAHLNKRKYMYIAFRFTTQKGLWGLHAVANTVSFRFSVDNLHCKS